MMLFLFVSCGKGEEQSIPSMIKAAYKGLESETWIRSIPRAKKFTASGEHADYDTKYRIGISAESMDKYIGRAIRAVRFGSYSILATLAGIFSFSRLKSITLYLRL